MLCSPTILLYNDTILLSARIFVITMCIFYLQGHTTMNTESFSHGNIAIIENTGISTGLESASSQNKENRQHSSQFIPYSLYDCRIPEYFPHVPMHWHNEFEIGYIIEGEGEFICAGERFLAHVGDIIFIPANMLHSTFPTNNNYLKYEALVFNSDMVGSKSVDRSTSSCVIPLISGRLDTLHHYDVSHLDYSFIRNLTETVMSCAKKNNPHDDLMLKSSLFGLLWYFEKPHNLSSEDIGDQSISDMIRPAVEYISYNYMNNLTVSTIAKKCNISESYFMNSFKKAVGYSCIDYLNQIRIKASCEDLRNTDHEISFIAYKNGFSNLSNFNRQFKKIIGLSPREYRHQIKMS